MYTKQEISRQKQAFWTAFGRYMKPVLSADREEINWINYKTGNKYVSFKMDVDRLQASIAVVVHHPDAEAQQNLFDRLIKLKDIFNETMEEDDWSWEPHATDEHVPRLRAVRRADDAVALHPLDHAGSAVVADPQFALQK